MRGEYLDVTIMPLALQRWAGDNAAPDASDAPATLKDAERIEPVLRSAAAREITSRQRDGNQNDEGASSHPTLLG